MPKPVVMRFTLTHCLILAPLSPQAQFSFLENWGKTHPIRLTGHQKEHINEHTFTSRSAKANLPGGSTTLGSHQGTESQEKWFLSVQNGCFKHSRV